MAGLGQRFDATQHDTEQRADYDELPNGIYKLEIESSEVKPTSSGNGTILKVTNVVIEPDDFKGRKLFNNYNLENANAQAQEIGQRQFASLCRAIGLDGVEDSDELHFIAYTAKVGLGKSPRLRGGGETCRRGGVMGSAEKAWAAYTAEGRPYMPGNGTEGEAFQDGWCASCMRDAEFRKQWNETGNPQVDGCEILAASLRGEQPKEWLFRNGDPICSAFTEVEPVGARCDKTGELF